jgi:4-amino-4-deoxy-L-arabinose transferase-like glycosyltransferase
MARFTSTVENHNGGPLVPVMQVLQGGWPWLPLWPGALLLAWHQRRQRAGRWALGLTLASLLLVLPMRTQLPWYSLLIWPPFALTCGPRLAQLWPAAAQSGAAVAQSGAAVVRGARRIGWIWLGLGALLLAGTALGFSGLVSAITPLRWLLLAAALGLIAGSGLGLAGPGCRWRRWAGPGLVAGWCTALALLMASPLWNWELAEQPSLDNRLLSGRLLPGELVLMESRNLQRPSAVWYSNALPGQLKAFKADGSGRDKAVEISREISENEAPPLE